MITKKAKYGTGTSVPNFNIDFSEVKVNVQGQNRCIENLPPMRE